MEHYVTLFDSGFAPQGLALHLSLQRHAGEHTLWVICMDQEVEYLLINLELPNVKVVPVADVETPELAVVRPSRTRAEYCWTLTPFSFDAIFERDPSASRVTYVDADVWLRADPQPIFDDLEVSGSAAQITEHAYAPEHDQTDTSGRFCVQFLTMDRERSKPIRNRWQEQCLEWCFARAEDGRFGDQKYLDDWPLHFQSLVNVASPASRFQGPWNSTRYPCSEAITFHFHSLRLAPNKLVLTVARGYNIPRSHRVQIYERYLNDLAHSLRLIRKVWGSAVPSQITSLKALAGLRHGGLKRLNVKAAGK